MFIIKTLEYNDNTSLNKHVSFFLFFWERRKKKKKKKKKKEKKRKKKKKKKTYTSKTHNLNIPFYFFFNPV